MSKYLLIWRNTRCLLDGSVKLFYTDNTSSVFSGKNIRIVYETAEYYAIVLFLYVKRVSLFLVIIDNIQGFPSSVTPDYVPFQIWDLLQVIIKFGIHQN